jgi:flagellar hook-length control protein FliK
LHLNPAEMGPVAVQIVMDGTHARIEFGADAAGTRQLIESSLPDLAAALREAGLTLTGGGVSQHPSGREAGDGTAAAGTPRDGTSGDAEPAPTAPRRSVRAGGVDVYA